MPYLKIETSADVSNPDAMLKKLSSAASKAIGKPEMYIMTSFAPVANMTFGGSGDNAVFIECKSIGLGKSQTSGLASFLCDFCKDELGVPQDRVYIEFANAEGAMWGWNGGTF